MPDGDYVYAIWAEIPFGGSNITINGREWNAVKTRMIHTGFLPVSRGNPDITIQPSGYSTIGSSPTAFGLDPFIFRYSLSRDSVVDVNIKTSSNNATDPNYLVKNLLSGTTQVANQMNVQTWDGKDDNGRFVSPGTYMLEVVAKDMITPTKQTTATIFFPVDLFRVVDVSTIPLLGEASAQARVSYMMSKSMHVKLQIYDKNVLIPAQGQSSMSQGNPNAPCPQVCQGGEVAPTASNPNPTNNSNNCIHYVGEDPVVTIPKAIKTFDGTRPGDGVMITESWDGYGENLNASNVWEQVYKEDGLYPYLICARSEEAGANYYQVDANNNPVALNGAVAGTGTNQLPNFLNAVLGTNPPATEDINTFMYATDKPTGYLTIARGPVYFNSIVIKPSIPQLFFSSETIQLPPYEVQLSVTRTAKVLVEIISMHDGMCTDKDGFNGTGAVCRTLTQQSPTQFFTIYDPIVINKLYWDGKDERGDYVKKDTYEFRFTAWPYTGPFTPDGVPMMRTELVPVNNFQVFDRFIWDVSPPNQGIGKFAYQLSVPMKTAIQIFKPGTRTFVPTNPGETIDGRLWDPANPSIPVSETSLDRVLVKAIIGVRPHLVALDDIWDGTDYAGQKVPDGVYPFRFVTVLDSYYMDSITGAVKATCSAPPCPPGTFMVQDLVADWDKFVNLGVIIVANGDSFFADLDWKSDRVTMFFPNPLRAGEGQFEITKVPAPGTVTIKIYNIAGDLVRDGGYPCINARAQTQTLEQINNSGGIQPDWSDPTGGTGAIQGGRNFALRCTWDKKNNHGKQVARGLYYAIMELNPTRGNAKRSQKVIKILIP